MRITRVQELLLLKLIIFKTTDLSLSPPEAGYLKLRQLALRSGVLIPRCGDIAVRTDHRSPEEGSRFRLRKVHGNVFLTPEDWYYVHVTVPVNWYGGVVIAGVDLFENLLLE